MTRIPSDPQGGASRRAFLKQAAAAAAGLALAPRAGARILGANERIGVGFIGVGGRGAAHMHEVKAVRERFGLPLELAAVCDAYRPRLDEAMRVHDVKNGYMDYRRLLEDPGVDVVAIATPDHLHGQQAIDAIRAGKDVFCEKPVTHWRQFELTRTLADTVAQSDRVFQLGTQYMSHSAWRQMKELVLGGLIGQPLFGETGFFRVGDWGERGMPVLDANAKPGPDLDWQAFLGDAPPREFSVDRFFRWRLFEDYAGGPVTDLFPHALTQVVEVLGVGFPSEVAALGAIHRYEYELREVPDTFNLVASYPEKMTITVLGSQGNDYTTGGGDTLRPIIRGFDGTLTIEGDAEIVFTPIGGLDKEPRRVPVEHGMDVVLHWKNFFDCVRARSQATFSPMDLAFRTQTLVQMAKLSSLAGKVARFDAERREIVI